MVLLDQGPSDLRPQEDRVSIFGAETIGTALLILLGDGVVAAVLLSHSKAENAGWIVITWGWAMGVMLGVFAVGQFSGAHLNPAVTLGFAVEGRTDWGDVPKYFAGEFAGAFVGAVLVYLSYLNHWRPTEDPGLKLAVFCTAPAIRNTVANIITEVIGTFVLVFGVLAIFADKTAAPGLGGLIVGLLVLGIGLSLGGPTGYAINPARDLAPRIAHALLPIPGKGPSDWGYAWIPVLGPLIGGTIAALLFKWFYP
jgi:glycerol uptake facilitator protein